MHYTHLKTARHIAGWLYNRSNIPDGRLPKYWWRSLHCKCRKNDDPDNSADAMLDEIEYWIKRSGHELWGPFLVISLSTLLMMHLTFSLLPSPTDGRCWLANFCLSLLFCDFCHRQVFKTFLGNFSGFWRPECSGYRLRERFAAQRKNITPGCCLHLKEISVLVLFFAFGPGMGFGLQLKLLLWKNFTLKKRAPVRAFSGKKCKSFYCTFKFQWSDGKGIVSF